MALSADRNTPFRDGEFFVYPVAASTTIYAGALVCLDSSGNAVPGSTTTGLIAVGKAEEHVDNSAGAAAAKTVKIRATVAQWANSDAVAKDSIGDMAYVVDDQTVAKGASGKSPAGIIVDVDANGVWVWIKPPVVLPTVGLTAANNLSDVGTAATAAHNLGLGTADSPTFAGLTLTGAAAGTTGAFSGILTALHGIATKTIAYTAALATDGDGVIQTATDNEVITLPNVAAGNKGMKVTVQNTGADGAAKVSVSPGASDKIKGQVGSVESGGVANKDLINTKATAKQGDFVTLISDGTDTWWIVGGIGVWASEA